jgi:hypothetical protein
MLVESMEGIGHNPGIFEASIPMAVHVERAETETAQVVEQLLKSRESSGQWNFCDSCIGNTGVTLRAQKQLNEAAQLKAADKKSEAHSAEGIRKGTGSTGEV